MLGQLGLGREKLTQEDHELKKKKEWNLSMRLIPLSRGADIFLEECWTPERGVERFSEMMFVKCFTEHIMCSIHRSGHIHGGS